MAKYILWNSREPFLDEKQLYKKDKYQLQFRYEIHLNKIHINIKNQPVCPSVCVSVHPFIHLCTKYQCLSKGWVGYKSHLVTALVLDLSLP